MKHYSFLNEIYKIPTKLNGHGRLLFHGTKNPDVLKWDKILSPKKSMASVTDGRVSKNLDMIFGTRSAEEALGYSGKNGYIVLMAPNGRPKILDLRKRNVEKFGQLYMSKNDGDILAVIPASYFRDGIIDPNTLEKVRYQISLHDMMYPQH